MKKSTRKSVSGPVDDSNLQTGNFSTRFSLPSFIKRAEKLTDDQRSAIQKMGFGNLFLVPNQTLSKNLLVELMERWDCEEQAFVLRPRKITITLVDVALILGLRVMGDSVCLNEDEPFSELESEYGVALWTRKITIASLESRLDSLGGIVNDDFIRTFLLFTFGTILFPNANGKVDSRYLSFLKNLDDVCQFAWGAAVLEDLFKWLSKRKEENVQYVGGCLILLQIWSYEHIDIARPCLLDSYLTFPRSCRWENSRSHQRKWFTTKFKEMQNDQIIWKLQPTSGELEVDIIIEILEAQSDRKQLVRTQISSTNISCINEDNLRIGSQTTDQKSSKVEIESEIDIVNEVHRVQEVNSDHLSTSKIVPEVLIETTESPSTSKDSSTDFTTCDEDNWRKRSQILEEQIIRLKEEMEELKMENILLRNQLLSDPPLAKQNIELKKEVDELKLQRSSSNKLVDRLERLLNYEDIDIDYSG